MDETPACSIDPNAPGHLMRCMEVWGGSDLVESSVVMTGLDAWVYSRPFEQAASGGDVYYVSSCATGRITRLLVADVTGHGSAVQVAATGLQSLMRRYVNYIDQSRFVQAMNGQFVALSENGNFATAVVTTFFAPTNRLSLCNAGHPPPLIYRGATRRWEYLELDESVAVDAANLPLGIVDLTDYEQFEVDLTVGDLVLCYTDSLTESYDADGQMLGQAGLLRVIQEEAVGEPSTFVPRLLDRIGGLRLGNLQNDDVTALLFRPNGSASTKSLTVRLMAPIRLAGAMLACIGRKKNAVPWPEASVRNLGGAFLSPLSRVGRRGVGRRGSH
jgi:sigma-B regulation protein RsbU (phosphoserine phosphatase)